MRPLYFGLWQRRGCGSVSVIISLPCIMHYLVFLNSSLQALFICMHESICLLKLFSFPSLLCYLSLFLSRYPPSLQQMGPPIRAGFFSRFPSVKKELFLSTVTLVLTLGVSASSFSKASITIWIVIYTIWTRVNWTELFTVWKPTPSDYSVHW